MHVELIHWQLRRDPRFDSLSGEYKEKDFVKGYQFLRDLRQRDIQALETGLILCSFIS